MKSLTVVRCSLWTKSHSDYSCRKRLPDSKKLTPGNTDIVVVANHPLILDMFSASLGSRFATLEDGNIWPKYLLSPQASVKAPEDGFERPLITGQWRLGEQL